MLGKTKYVKMYLVNSLFFQKNLLQHERKFHFSETTFRESNMQYRNANIAGIGEEQGSEFKIRVVDSNRARKIRGLAES